MGSKCRFNEKCPGNGRAYRRRDRQQRAGQGYVRLHQGDRRLLGALAGLRQVEPSEIRLEACRREYPFRRRSRTVATLQRHGAPMVLAAVQQSLFLVVKLLPGLIFSQRICAFFLFVSHWLVIHYLQICHSEAKPKNLKRNDLTSKQSSRFFTDPILERSEGFRMTYKHLSCYRLLLCFLR